MTLNPYEPPRELPELTGGAWRDGELLVAPTDRPASFPLRCIVSGVPVPATSKIQTEACFPERSIFQKSITLICPVDRRRVPAVRLIDYVAWSLLFAAGFLFTVYWTTQYLPSAHRISPRVLMLGFALMLASIFLRALFARRLLTLRKIKGQYAWIDGAHPDFLKDLPPWPGLPHE